MGGPAGVKIRRRHRTGEQRRIGAPGMESTMADLESLAAPGSEEGLLLRQLDPSRFPRHVAVIMDGNGRWARRRHLPRVAGHRAGIKSVRETVESAARLGIEVLTLYAFSQENWKR